MDFENELQRIWHRCRNLNGLDQLNTELVEKFAIDRGLAVEGAIEENIGIFAPSFKSIVLTVNGRKAGFPKISADNDPDWLKRKAAFEKQAAIWQKVEWFAPLWVANGDIGKLLKDIEHRDKKRAVEMFHYHTSTIYTLGFQAVCIAQLMPKARCLQDFHSVAREAFLSFYSGYRASSIAALIPLIEGTLARINTSASQNLKIPDRVNRLIDGAIRRAAELHFNGIWVPPEYMTKEFLFARDERVFFFETFRRWLNESFFQNTDNYDGATWLNRHIFAHGISNDWQQPSNFSRLIVALTTIGVVEAWHDNIQGVSLFFPGADDESELLWKQARIRGDMQLVIKTLEAKSYQGHGKLVPKMPNDDGSLLRKAELSRQCIADLVRPLRNAGWTVDVSEPDDKALFMTVLATSGEDKLKIALLYSCGTANELYKEFDKTCQVILYLGAPYRQAEFAYGIKAHVGPVTGWQPPQARVELSFSGKGFFRKAIHYLRSLIRS